MSRARASRVAAGAACLAIVLLAGCGGSEHERAPQTTESAHVDRSPAPPATSLPRIVILGDSITAGLGVPMDRSFPSVLQQRLTERHLGYQVVNAGVSGDTSAGGVSRLDWALEGDVRVLVIALGGNDGLRGLPVAELRRNLETMIERGEERHITVVLAGMEAPPNFGPEYTAAFRAVYPELARTHHIALVPFLLQGVAGIDAVNQGDGIHPNVRGAEMVANNVWTVLGPIVEGQARRD